MEKIIEVGVPLFINGTLQLDIKYIKSILDEMNDDFEKRKYILVKILQHLQNNIKGMLKYENFSNSVINSVFEALNLSNIEQEVIIQCNEFLDILVQTVMDKLKNPNVYKLSFDRTKVITLLMEYLNTECQSIVSQYLHLIDIYTVYNFYIKENWHELEFLSPYETQIIQQTTGYHKEIVVSMLPDLNRFLQLFPQFVNYIFFNDTPVELFQLLHYYGKNLDYEFGTGKQFSVLHSLLYYEKYEKIQMLITLGANQHIQKDGVSFVDAFKKYFKNAIEIYEMIK